MSRGSGVTIQTDVFKTFAEKEVKKEAEETPVLWDPSGEKHRFLLQGIIVSFNSTAGYWKFFDEATEIFGLNVKAIAATEAALQITFPVGYESVAPDNELILKSSTTSAKVSLVVFGTEVV